MFAIYYCECSQTLIPHDYFRSLNISHMKIDFFINISIRELFSLTVIIIYNNVNEAAYGARVRVLS